MNFIDIHCHILPGIDDGAKDMHMALEMARIAADHGTTDIIATPHHNNGVFLNPLAQVHNQLEPLQSAIDSAGIKIRLHPGAEVHLTPEIIDELKAGVLPTYADQGKAVLVELPKQHIPIGTQQILKALLNENIVPIIAHPERNSEILYNPMIYEAWVRWGVRGQLTAMSVDGRFGQAIQRLCRRWLNVGMAHFIASDAHRAHGRSPKLFSTYQYVVENYNKELADLLIIENPRRLMNGERIKSPKVLNAMEILKPAESFQKKNRRYSWSIPVSIKRYFKIKAG